MDLGEIGHRYKVHFAVIGTAGRQDGRLSVAAILYETVSGRTVSVRRLNIQDSAEAHAKIAQVLYETFWQASVDEEATRATREHPNSLDKRDLLFAALSTRLSAPSKAHWLEKIALIERALALDPNYFLALERQA
jgi:hypothetical protein